MNRYYFYLTACLILCLLDGCRQELPMIRSEVEYVTMPSDPQSVEGFFLVNEGNMGSNKCTIDHFDARTGSYFRKDSDNLFFHNRLHRFSWFLAY